MKNALLITTTPTVGGNGDTLISAAMEAAQEQGAEVTRVDIRDKHIQYCKACYACAKDGVCCQEDDFPGILKLLHQSDGVIMEAPIYYNCMAAQAITAINRLCCTFAYKEYALGPMKKVGVFLTCTGSVPEEMKRHVTNILTLPSVARAITDYRIEVFTGCNLSTTCLQNADYLERARSVGKWVTT